MQQFGRICICLLGLALTGAGFVHAEGVSPRRDVRDNFQQLIETNDCQGCDLSGAVLNRFDLSGVNLAGANLAGAKLYLVDLSGANLTGANLQGAELGGADLARADLTGANLTGAVLEGAYLVGAKMDGQIVTRRPYVEGNAPAAGERVFVDDEGDSKNLPYTGPAMVATEEESAPEEMTEDMAEALPGKMANEQAGGATKQAPAEPSKKLVMIAEPVIPASEPSEAMQQKEMAPQSGFKPAADMTKALPQQEPPTEQAGESVPAAAMPAEAQEKNFRSAPPAEQVVAALPETMTKQPSEVRAEPAPEMRMETRHQEPQAEAPDMTAAKPAAAAGPMQKPAVEAHPAATVQPAAAEEKVAPVMTEDPAESRQKLIEKLLDENRCVECNLSGVDLAGKDLDEADLERADFRKANLRKADLREANLKGVDFRGADLRDADLREADMYRANLAGADLTGARFEGTLIDSIQADGAVGADFTGALPEQK